MATSRGTQVRIGKAFEHACACAIHEKYHNIVDVRMLASPQADTAERFFLESSHDEQMDLIAGARSAIRVIDRLEPRLSDPSSPLVVALQTDSRGQAGDVRDVLCIRDEDGWEIGLSCKHDHDAVKHSRLSERLDFGAVWFGRPCSQDYMDEVRDIFSDTAEMRSRGVKWEDVPNKEQDYYIRTLSAFLRELAYLDRSYPGEIPRKLIQYLIGREDFYKVITNDRRRFTTVQAININGTLNRPLGRKRALVDVPRLKLPTQFYQLGFKKDSDNTVIIVCDEGWNVAMRIHSADKVVETSLKFDVRLIATPSSILTQMEPWEDL